MFGGGISGFCAAGQASNGWEALNLLQKDRYDLLITDIRMPKVDGIELLKEVKKRRLCPCVVLLSEYSEFAYARQGLVLGAFDYLVKPVDAGSLQHLFLRVADFLEEKNVSVPSEDGKAVNTAMEAKRIVDGILARREEAAALAENVVNGLYEFYHENLAKTVLAVNRIMDDAVLTVWQACTWMRKFYRMETFESGMQAQFSTITSYHSFLTEKIKNLAECIWQFKPLDMGTTIGQVCLYMLEHPEADISLKAMADLFYINRSYLSNTFRKKTGFYFTEYLTVIRMERARYLLETEDLKIYEICLRLGYHDQEYFSKLFKKIIGMNPMALRRAGQNRDAG